MTGKWVLVMDDDAILRYVVCRMLESAGYQAYAGKDGVEAVWIYRKAKECGKTFDAVILDLNVPRGMGGKETIRALHAMEPDVRAIVMSGDSTDPAIMDHKAFGFRAVLGKPFTQEQLVRTLQAVLDNSIGVPGGVHEAYTGC